MGREELSLTKYIPVWCIEGFIAARFAVGDAFYEALLAVVQRASLLLPRAPLGVRPKKGMV